MNYSPDHTVETPYRIMIVEDDLNLGFLLMDHLESYGFQVRLCRDGESGLRHFRKTKFDLCILDVMMPKMDGFQLAYELKIIEKDVNFLFLTARSLKNDKLKGYHLGADDYITKPFDEEELICKIYAILRRSDKKIAGEKLPARFTFGHFNFDFDRQELSFKGKTIRLTEKENEILRLLCLNKNRVLRRDEAVEIIYGKKDYFLGRSFDVFISRLRKLLSSDPGVSIENVYRVGFMLNVPGGPFEKE